MFRSRQKKEQDKQQDKEK